MRPSLIFLLVLLTLLLGLVLAWQYTGNRAHRVAAQARQTEQRLLVTQDSLRTLLAAQDSLRALAGRTHGEGTTPSSLAWRLDLDELRDLGLADPVAMLRADLMRHPELIPYKGVLGGRMGFYSPGDIVLLNSRWVYARFNDGHIVGFGIFEFSVAPGGRIRWKTVAAMLLE